MFKDVGYTDLIPVELQTERRAIAISAVSILESEDEVVPEKDMENIVKYIQGQTNLAQEVFPAAAIIRAIEGKGVIRV